VLVLVLNGPINAGKTTTGRALAAMLADAHFVDGDDHEAADDAPLAERISASFARIERMIGGAQAAVLVIASPLRDEDVERLGAACLRRAADLRVVTLAPPIEVALSNRGSRQLRPDEISRSRRMYAEGYATRAFSDLLINDMTTPEACARQIARHFGLSMSS
tara:strand:- start:17171 stop:17659 length:489 start_codon:yes stop_codon:yes gene_type:complete